MKKILTVILTLMLTLAPLSCLAQSIVEDNALLFTSAEESAILDDMERLSRAYDCNISIITVNQSLTDGALSYAHSRYDALYGYGTDGILLVINVYPSAREWAISFNGKYAAFENYDLMGNASQQLTKRNYYQAISVFLENAGAMMEYQLQNPDPNAPNPYTVILICFVLGLIIALIAVFSMKSNLKSVRSKATASDYVVKNSFRLTNSRDIYLYSTVTRVPIPKNNSSSSGGSRSRGGASGRF